MDQSFFDVLTLFAAGATRNSYTLDHPIDIHAIRRISLEQGIWPIVYSALLMAAPDAYKALPGNERETYRSEVLTSTIRNMQCNIQNRAIFTGMREAGIPCCLLKGESIAILYQEPACRISSDTDILIPGNSVKKALGVMKALGYTVDKRKFHNHVCCYHPVGGLVELHLSLYNELYEDVWFDNKIFVKESYRDLTFDDSAVVPVLGITDGFIFTALHFIRHFLSRGAGIRQMMDTLLYAFHYNEQIDWDRVNELLRYLKYDVFLNAVYQIGAKYFFLTNRLPYNSEPADEAFLIRILEDIKRGGLFGQKEKERKNFYIKYTEARFDVFKKGLNYKKYIREWREIPLRIWIFPSRRAMANKYPIIKKSVLLVPVVWILYEFRLFTRIISGDIQISEDVFNKAHDNDVINQRMDLIKDLKMI